VARWRLVSPGVAVAAVLAVLFTFWNLQDFRTAGRNYRRDAALSRADVFAIQVARDRVDRDFQPADARDPELETGHILGSIEDGRFLVSESDIRDAPEWVRQRADATLIAALRIGPREDEGAAGSRHRPQLEGVENARVRLKDGCTRLEPQLGTANVTLRSGTGRLLLSSEGPAKFSLRRFAQAYRPTPDFVLRGSRVLDLPRDRSTAPWHLGFTTGSAVRVCAGRRD
jgi:hypothetical protein